jgi:quinol monooxygenase YgiN
MTDGDRDVVTLIVTMTFKPAKEQDFLELAKDVIEQVRANEPDTTTYVLTKHPSEPHTYVWIERYRHQQALAAHNEASYLAVALQKLPDWWAKAPEVLNLIQVDSAHQ